MSVILFNKKYRETLVDMLIRFRVEQEKYADAKITYAGRLDPLAEGLMILLTDKDVHHKDSFNKLDKVYQVDFMFGFETDTYDILGISKNDHGLSLHSDTLQKGINNLLKTKTQSYPAYSSKTVEGKPLWQWAREGADISKIAPMRSVEIYSARYISDRVISIDELQANYIQPLIEINGDFRQKDIVNKWGRILSEDVSQNVTIYTAEFHVSSGTYIRSLIHQLGKNLGTSAVCIKISRLQVGDHHSDKVLT